MSPLNFYALNMHSVHWGMKPFKNTTLLFFAKPPLKSANYPSPPAFSGNLPNILVFRKPLQKSDFSANPHNIKILHF